MSLITFTVRLFLLLLFIVNKQLDSLRQELAQCRRRSGRRRIEWPFFKRLRDE